MDMLIVDIPRLKNTLGDQGLYKACESGNLSVAKHIAKYLYDSDGFGINKVHLQALSMCIF